MFIRLKRFKLLYKVYMAAQRIQILPEGVRGDALKLAVQQCREYENSELTDQMCFGNTQKDHAETNNKDPFCPECGYDQGLSGNSCSCL